MLRRLFALAIAVLLFPVQLLAGPEDAVVRIPSHGASATVIHTERGRTMILGCGHAYRGADRNKAMTIDVPVPQGSAPKVGRARLVDVDYQADLSLVELLDGPLPYEAPVPPAGYRVSRRLLAVGYDEMRTPPQKRPTTILSDDGRLWHTRERPWHGRSGGGLIDLEGGYCVGVCSGYTGPRNHAELHPGAEGLYVDLAAIQRFLGRNGFTRKDPVAAPQAAVPQYYRSPFPAAPAPQCPS